jgi:nucleotide-binding universal stress UspA family protein
MTMKKIIVAYDFSAEAEKALDHTVAIANPDDEIVVLLVLPEPDSVFGNQSTLDISSEQLQMKLDLLKQKYMDTGLKLSIVSVQGNIVEEILKASNDPECRLIVIGYKGVSKIGRFKLGNISGQVAKLSKKPVLVVK